MGRIKLQRMCIENFMSIDQVSFTIPSGITELLGENQDSGGSNGAGKSSLLLSIPQCLYNKNPNLALRQVNNTVTGKPYRLVLTLTAGNVEYVIDNDRNKNKIIVTRDGVVVTTRIKESLIYIESEILKLTYDEFITLTFITSKSLMSIFDITSANLLLKLFNLHKIDDYIDVLKTERRSLNRELVKLKTVRKPKVVDVRVLDTELTQLKDELSQHVDTLKAIAEEHTMFDQEELTKLLYDQSMVASGMCPTCGQVVDTVAFDNDKLQRLIARKDSLDSNLRKEQLIVSNLTSKITTLEAKRVGYLEVAQVVDADNSIQREDLTHKISKIDQTLVVISRGTVHQVYLNQFLLILNSNLQKLQKYNFIITAELVNSSIKYKVCTDGTHKEVVQLSGGESTTVALIILLAIYNTLRCSLGIDINLLILDEAIHMVDADNKDFIAMLLNSMCKDIIIVQHADIIPTTIIKNNIVVQKREGVTTLKDAND